MVRTDTPEYACAGAFGGVRILDLTNSSEQYCGKLFAQMGAHVTLIEPPNGVSTRHRGPYLFGETDPNNSVLFNYLNLGKDSVVIDLNMPGGRKALHTLVEQADVLIQSYTPAESETLGLDYETLRAINPRIIVTSITSFGQDGPYSDFVGDDLISMALGGFLYLGGYSDSPPIGAPGDQALLAAAQFAAVATAIALWDVERDACKEGKHIDVSAQESMAMGLETAVQFAELEGFIRRRQGGEQRLAGMGVFPCKDGQVYYMAGGVGGGRFWQQSTQWLLDENVTGAETLMGPEWLDRSYISTDEAKRKFYDVFVPFTITRSKAQLYEEAQRRRLPLCPVCTPSDVIANAQLAFREFFVQANSLLLNKKYLVPGAPFKMSLTPCLSLKTAPALPTYDAAFSSARS